MRYRNNALASFLLLALTGLAMLNIYLQMPPEAKPETAPATEFSAVRAMQHVQQIAREPHAMGTAAHAQVREYLLESMQSLGLNPQVQETTVARQAGAAAYAGYVYNLIGRLPGKGSGKAVLLMAHYDSQPNALGAGDDGAGVAAILETARALQQGEQLEHDVIFLLTDGEEYGLYGARAFLEHPWAKDVALVINVEGRGNEGPSMTFEMSPENGWVVKEYVKAAPYPFVSSLAYEIYSRMPNDTDFTVFKNAGYTGVNSAFIDGFVHYHKATDSPENLDVNSLQHHGSNMLALTRHFGSISLEQTKAPDSVFFNFIDGWVISYPKWLNWLWITLTTLALIAAFAAGKQKGAFRIGQVILGFLLFLGLLVMIVGLFIPINSLVTGMLPLSHSFNGLYSANGFFIAYLLLALGLFMLLTWVALRWLPLFALMMGVYLVFFLLTLGVLLIVPAAAYLLMFPLLFSLCGTVLVFVKDLHQQEGVCFRYALTLLLASVPAILIMMPIVHVVFVAFALQLPAGTVALFVLLLSLLLPLLVIIERSFSWRFLPLLPIVLLLVGIIQVVRAIDTEAPSPDRPLHSQVAYYLNADEGKAFWTSTFKTTDEWNRQFFPDAQAGTLQGIYPHAGRQYLKNKATALDLAPPVAELLQDSTSAMERLLRIRLHSPRNAAHMEIILQPQNSPDLFSVSMNKRELDLTPIKTEQGNIYYIRYHGLPVSKEGLLEVRLKPDTPLKLLLYDHTLSLPEQLIKTPKPAHVIAEQGDNSNITVVKKTYHF